MPARRILVADDDRAIREALARALRLEGYDVTLAADGVEAMTAARSAGPDAVDVIVLDIGMPLVDGLAVARLLRAEGVSTPILMLTARVDVDSRVAGLDAGADDYLAKPFELAELLARLRALLRRVGPTPPGDDSAVVTLGDLRLDEGRRRAWFADSELSLSKTEFDLLALLATHPGQVLPHATIYQRIWEYDFGPDSNNLAVYISYVRRKLLAAGAPDLIRTVRGVGYAIEQP